MWCTTAVCALMTSIETSTQIPPVRSRSNAKMFMFAKSVQGFRFARYPPRRPASLRDPRIVCGTTGFNGINSALNIQENVNLRIRCPSRTTHLHSDPSFPTPRNRPLSSASGAAKHFVTVWSWPRQTDVQCPTAAPLSNSHRRTRSRKTKRSSGLLAPTCSPSGFAELYQRRRMARPSRTDRRQEELSQPRMRNHSDRSVAPAGNASILGQPPITWHMTKAPKEEPDCVNY